MNHREKARIWHTFAFIFACLGLVLVVWQVDLFAAGCFSVGMALERMSSYHYQKFIDEIEQLTN